MAGGPRGGDLPRIDQSECALSIAKFVGNVALDAAIVWTYWSGVSLVVRGTQLVAGGSLLLAEGAAMRSGLILTSDVNGMGLTGAMESVVGRAAMANGRAVSLTGAGAVASVGAQINFFLPVNALNFARSGGFAGCKRR